VVHRILAGIFKAAVRDRRIVASPCEGTKLPKVHRQRIEPMALEAVEALTKAMPERYRALVTLAVQRGSTDESACTPGTVVWQLTAVS
jgi:hypothetical protein